MSGFSGGAGSVTAGQLPATATNDSASAGNLGEYIESVVLIGSATALTTATTKTVTSISLTAGDWDVFGDVYIYPAVNTVLTKYQGGISNTNNTLDTAPGRYCSALFPATTFDGNTVDSLAAYSKISLSATTTIYLVAFATFTTSTCAAYGIIRARRAR